MNETLLQTFKPIFQDLTIPLQIHSEGITSFLIHPDEAYLAVAFRLGLMTSSTPPLETPEYLFCERMLKKVSRSFALVIQTLPRSLRVSVCIFYLVLRALDTIEDDMTAFRSDRSKKVVLLRTFASKLSKPSWALKGLGTEDEKALLEQFPKVLSVYHTLSKEDQAIVHETCLSMGNGMADFVEKDIRLGTASVEEYNLYCHIVAGLVGQGLTRLFVAHGNEDKSLLTKMTEANEMGLFLQKTNIIRDYLEDLQEGRTFWPRSLWKRYVPTLLDLRTGDQEKALECLNEMILDAYSHVPACLRYLESLKDPAVFKFCAIPQIMAIATLERLTNNPDVFTGIVKIRKGLMLTLFQHTSTIQEVKGIVSTYSDAILASLPPHTQAHKHAIPLMYTIQGQCVDGIQPSKPWPSFVSLLLSISILVYSFFQRGKRDWMDLLLLATMVLFLLVKKSMGWMSKIAAIGSS
jgi:farnesyl-diphosphate farnesyltransferase